MKLYTRAADLGSSDAHYYLGVYYSGGDTMKKLFHYEAAAMAGHKEARCNLVAWKKVRKHGTSCETLYNCGISWVLLLHATLRILFVEGSVNREIINSTLAAYNNSCAKGQRPKPGMHISAP